ncbi:ABC transporter ATP-binding protein (plasmid) [Nitrobacteraceae bacterium UC4446_H13]
MFYGWGKYDVSSQEVIDSGSVSSGSTRKNLAGQSNSDATPNAEGVSIGAIALRLLRLMRRRRILLVLAIICATLAALCSLLPYLAVALALIEVAASTPDWTWILTIGIAAIVAVLVEKLLFGLATGLSHTVAFGTQRDLRFELAEKLACVPLGYTEEKSKGEIRTTLIDDIEILEDGMAHLVPEVSAAVIAPVVTLIVMLVIDWRLGLLMVLPILVGATLLSVMMKRGEKPTREYFALFNRMATTSAEIADGLPTVRAFNQDEQTTARARNVFAEMSRFSNAWVHQAVLPGSAAQVLLSSHLLFVGPAGLFMAASGWVSTATLAAFLAIAYGFGDLFAALHGISHRLMQQVQLLARIDRLQNAAELPAPIDPKVPHNASVSFDNVSFAYGARTVLSDLSFKVNPGQCLALVGPSGSGKSTIARLASRFHDVGAGAIRIGGVDVRDLQSEALHKQIAYVFQDVFLFGGTVADNIRLGRSDATDEEVIAAARSAQAHDFIARLPKGYQTILGERGYGLSGGERQRISIARAILKNAPILVLDEATAFADPENEAQIQDAVAQLAQGRTVIVIAHRLHTIVHADEILVLDQGRIVERGRHADLIKTNGLFARMWQAQEEARTYRHATEDRV